MNKLLTNLLWPAAVLVMLCLGGILYYYYTYHHVRDAYLYARHANVSVRVTGHIDDIKVSNNAFVKNGQTLFELDATPYQLQYNQAKADMASAKQKVELFQQTLEYDQQQLDVDTKTLQILQTKIDRYQELLSKNVVSQQDFDGVNQQYLQAKAKLVASQQQYSSDANELALAKDQLAQAQAKFDLTSYELSQTKIVAPVSGYVTNLKIQQGDVIQVGDIAMAIVPQHPWWVIANTKEYVLKDLAVGQTVRFTTSLTGGKSFTGTIDSIGHGILRDLNDTTGLPYVNPTVDWIRVDKRFPVWIKIDQAQINPNQPFRIGADAKVWYE